MTQAALLFIKADTTLYNGIHTDTIWRTFAETHILPWITGIAKPSTNYPEIKLINSLNFMQGKANLSVYLPQYELGTYTVTNNLQQVIVQEKFHGDNFFLASGVIKTAGIYYLTITTPTYTVTKKFMIE